MTRRRRRSLLFFSVVFLPHSSSIQLILQLFDLMLVVELKIGDVFGVFRSQVESNTRTRSEGGYSIVYFPLTMAFAAVKGN